MRPEEIYKAGEFDYNLIPHKSQVGQEHHASDEYYQSEGQPEYPMTLGIGGPGGGGINFAPVIKIFNEGNDMSQTSPNGNDIVKMRGQEPQSIENLENESGVKSSDEFIDFSKPIIIKKS